MYVGSERMGRRLLNIDDPRVMTERLRAMMTNLLEEISDLPAKVTADPDSIDGGNGGGLTEDAVGPTGDG